MKSSYPKLQYGRFLIPATFLLITLLLNACGGTQPTANSQPAANPNSVPSQQPVPTQPNTVSMDSLPGTEEFGMSKEELVQNIEALEALIAVCMSDAGFEYVAVDYNTARQGMLADKSLPGLSEKQFFDQYGYGISTLYTGLDPQVADMTTPARIGLGADNLRIFDSLSPADQVAYNHTLFGEHPDATFAVTLEAEDFSRTGGCTRAAIEQVFEPEQLTVTYFNPLDALIAQDPRMIAGLEAWSACMRDAGFDYNTPEDTEPDMKTRLDAITQGVKVEEMSAADQAALVQLQGEERSVAVADYNCGLQFVEPVAQQVERELLSGS